MAGKSDIQLRKEFDKETFKEMVKENVKTLYRRTIDEATQQQLFQAVSYAINVQRNGERKRQDIVSQNDR